MFSIRSRDPLGPLERLPCSPSLMWLFLPLYAKVAFFLFPSLSSYDHDVALRAAHELGSCTAGRLSGSFCEVLFFRNAGPTIVFPHCATHVHSCPFPSFNLVALYGDPPPRYHRVFLCFRFRTPSTSRQIGKCAPPRIHWRYRYAPPSRGSIYASGRPTSRGDAVVMSRGIPVERGPRFIESILETCRARIVRRIFSNLLMRCC